VETIGVGVRQKIDRNTHQQRGYIVRRKTVIVTGGEVGVKVKNSIIGRVTRGSTRKAKETK